MRELSSVRMTLNNPMKLPANRDRMSRENPMKRPEISILRTGVNNPACRPEVRAKISKSNTGRFVGEKSHCFGKPKSEKTRKLLSDSHKGKQLGSDNPNWKGGRSFEPYCPKWTTELRRRIRAFFGYECVICGKHQNENIDKSHKSKALSCHHVYYNKQACCDGKEVHFAALCMNCHAKTGHNRERWQEIIHKIIDEIYDGRSYYTKYEYLLIKNKKESNCD
jgi:hypothetical protein